MQRDSEEILWLAGGIASEADKIKRYTIGQYLDLLKYKVDHTKKDG